MWVEDFLHNYLNDFSCEICISVEKVLVNEPLQLFCGELVKCEPIYDEFLVIKFDGVKLFNPNEWEQLFRYYNFELGNYTFSGFKGENLSGWVQFRIIEE